MSEESRELTRLLHGYRVSQAIHVAAVLGIADLLAQGPRSADDLAAATGTNPDTLYRLLRALASVGVFTELDDRTFAPSALADGLRSDAPGSLRYMAMVVGNPYTWNAWGELLHSVQTGENAFRHLHGQSIWEYREQHPEAGAVFDRAMASQTAAIDESLLAAYDFSQFGTVVDVGGGRGALLEALLAANGEMHGVLFDQPHVVAGIEIERCRVVGGSFFDGVPEGGDAYVLKWIIHDWEDPESAAILRSVRRAIPGHGKLLVVERLPGPPDTNFFDLMMLVGPGGRERSLDEFASLFASAAFELVGETPTASPFHVIEARPV